MLRRIAITGPESTGKSWLAKALSEEFHEPWVPEYARTYLNQLGSPYGFDDVVEIARGQYRNEEAMAAKAVNWLFCDTEFLVTRIWSLVKFGRCHPWIDAMADRHVYDHYLLCHVDLPWEADPLREHPGLRQELFQMYRKELDDRGVAYSIVSGMGDDRLQCAIQSLAGIR